MRKPKHCSLTWASLLEVKDGTKGTYREEQEGTKVQGEEEEQVSALWKSKRLYEKVRDVQDVLSQASARWRDSRGKKGELVGGFDADGPDCRYVHRHQECSEGW